MLIEWQDQFAIQNPEIDYQHRQLFALANRFFRELESGISMPQVQATFRELAYYTVVHFNQEEKLMEETGNPTLESHRKLHDVFKKKVEEFALDLADDHHIAAQKMMEFLAEWLVHHITVVDKYAFKHPGMRLHSDSVSAAL
jgi:hemerythrin-like metal-binding protein